MNVITGNKIDYIQNENRPALVVWSRYGTEF